MIHKPWFVSPRSFHSLLGRISSVMFGLSLAAILTMVLAPASVNAQNPTGNGTPTGLAPGSPAGSYSLSDFEDVNLFSGSLNFSLPIMSVGGRGSAGYLMRLNIQQRWVIVRYDLGNGQVIYVPEATLRNDGSGPISVSSPGSMSVRYRSDDDCNRQPRAVTLHTDLQFTASDGTEYVLRDQIYDGAYRQTVCPGPGVNRGNVFSTRDGTAMTFVSDEPVVDQVYNGSGGISGNLWMRDGTCYRFDGGAVSWIRDRNGNMVRFPVIIPGTTIPDGRFITDSLNRQVTIEYVSDVAPYGVCTRIRFKGASGVERIIRISQARLSNALRTTQPGDSGTVLRLNQLFPSSTDDGVYDPVVNSAVWLPDGRSYQFKYNVYGELARVTLPTGGAIEYDFADMGLVPDIGSYAVFRRLIARRVYPDGGVGAGYEQLTTYNQAAAVPGNNGNIGYVAVSVNQYAPGNPQPLASENHYFFGDPTTNLTGLPLGQYPRWKEGREWKTELFDFNGAVLRRTEHTWRQRPSTFFDSNQDAARLNDPRIIETVTTLADADLVSKQTFDYDQYNNQTDFYEYGFGVGAPGPLIRHTQKFYLTTNPYQGGVDYAAELNIHIRDLPREVNIFDGNGELVSKALLDYDRYELYPLQDCQGIVQHDGSFGVGYGRRGNLIKKTQLATISPATYVDEYFKYDIAGNVVKTVDARNVPTDVSYDDNYGAPDNEAQSNAGAPELAGGFSYAFPTRVTNILGHTAYTQYDYYTGKTVNSQGPNGVVSSIAYNDVLDRPTQGIQARYMVGVGVPAMRRQTTITYDDTNHVITSTSDLNTFNDNSLASKSYYDSLGRTRRSAAREGATWSIKDTKFDALGRVSQVSNPFRAADPDSASPPSGEFAEWTSNNYDALGRVTMVISPDGAHVDTAYSGNQVTVTDQAGKRRRSENDARGRLIKLTEDPDGLAYVTNYTYDALGNLRLVTQGAQTRTFDYDSVSRLISATNPESGTITYAYDPNGNLLEKIDPRGVKTTMTYDDLNRVRSRTYSGTTPEGTAVANATPQVNYFYDGYTGLPSGAPTFPGTPSKGRMVGITYGSGSAGTYYKYDDAGRVVTNHQRIGNANYVTAYFFNLVDAVTREDRGGSSQTRRRNWMSYDAAGRPLSMQSGAFNGFGIEPHDLVSDISYTPFGALQSETYGNGLIHSMAYNNRRQPIEIRLGRLDNLESVLRIGYIYGAADNVNGQDTEITLAHNNGNVARIKYFISGSLQYSQTFQYDQVNRLRYAVEHNNGTYNDAARAWYQTFAFDQFGNRGIDIANTSGNAGASNNPLLLADFSEVNNRIRRDGFVYDASGNLIAEPGKTFAYDAENRIVTAVVAGVGTSQYFYDGSGNRVRKVAGSVTTRFEYGVGDELIAEWNDADTNKVVQKDYLYNGGELLATTRALSSVEYEYAVADHLGTPRAWTDNSGAMIAGGRHDYLPYGVELFADVGTRTTDQGYASSAQQDGQRKQFDGYQRDIETGLDFAEARYYASVQGRFTSVDPLLSSGKTANPQSWNRYTFALNNPLRLIDPSGMDPDEAQKRQAEIDFEVAKRRIDEVVKSGGHLVIYVAGIKNKDQKSNEVTRQAAGELMQEMGIDNATVVSVSNSHTAIQAAVGKPNEVTADTFKNIVEYAIQSGLSGSQISVIAHSNGNPTLAKGIESLQADTTTKGIQFNSVTLVAPNTGKVDAITTIAGASGRVDLYNSTRDPALAAAQKVGNAALSPQQWKEALSKVDSHVNVYQTTHFGHSFKSYVSQIKAHNATLISSGGGGWKGINNHTQKPPY